MDVSREKLQAALAQVRPGLADRELLEQSTSFAFVDGRVVTYNDAISVQAVVEGLTELTGAVDAGPLYSFLNRTKAPALDVSWDEKQITVVADRAKAGFLFEAVVKIPIINVTQGWRPIPENLIKAMQACASCCSDDMSRPVLTCVHVDKTHIEASDSYQIIRYTLPEDLGVSFLIPAKSVEQLMQYKVTEYAVGAEGDNWVHFKAGDVVFSARVLSGEFPNVEPHLDVPGAAPFEFPEALIEILARANVFSEGKATLGSIPIVNVTIEKTTMKIESRNEVGWFEEDIDIPESGVTTRFTIGTDSLSSILQSHRVCTVGTTKIGFKGDGWEHVIATATGGA